LERAGSPALLGPSRPKAAASSTHSKRSALSAPVSIFKSDAMPHAAPQGTKTGPVSACGTKGETHSAVGVGNQGGSAMNSALRPHPCFIHVNPWLNTIFWSDHMPHAAPQTMKMGWAIGGAKRLGVRQASGAFARGLLAKAAEDCRSPRRFAHTHPTAIFWSGPLELAVNLQLLYLLDGRRRRSALPVRHNDSVEPGPGSRFHRRRPLAASRRRFGAGFRAESSGQERLRT
jgi:hypothetical protein